MRILALTSSTGGGHDMRARALRSWVEQGGSAFSEVEILQVLESTHSGYAFGVWLYNVIQRRMPRAHHLYFNFLEHAALHRRERSILGAARFQERVARAKPDVVVSTHAHLNHGFFDLARRTRPGKPTPCITYCGELSGGYGFSRHWVNPAADGFIGATHECVQAARARGMPEDRAVHGGFLLRPAFYQPGRTLEQRHAWVRDKLGMDPERFLLVISTGANGANNHVALLGAIERAGFARPPQVIALCGNNEASLRAINAWSARRPGWPVRALPRHQDMPTLLRCASTVVARPGTGTTSEAVVCGCPVLFNGLGGVMPQERITLDYLAVHGEPAVVKKPPDLPRLLRPWLENAAELEKQAAWMRSLRPELSPSGILDWLADRIR